MSSYLVKRALGAIAVMIALLLFTFFATYFIGDPIALLVDPELSSEQEIAEIRAAAGLDQPIWQQFWNYGSRVVRGDFGTSLFHHRPASELVFDRLPATIRLALITVTVVVIASVSLALIATRARGTATERVILFVATALACVPSFWLALVLIVIFAVNLAWLPTSGIGGFRYTIMPVVALAALPIGHMTQVLHAGLQSEVAQPYVAVARAKGLTERALLTTHVLRNSLVLLMTIVGSMLASLLNGAVLVEAVFAWPGIGDLGLQAVRQRDLPVLTAVVFYAGVMVTMINFGIDLIYARLDPRVRLP
jgi:peptide/nickel transport system permease protein